MVSSSQALLARINEFTAKIGVIGLGYVGLPLAQAFAHAGFYTVGFELDQQKINLLQQEQSYIKHISSKDISRLVATGRFQPTMDHALLAEMDVIIVCVPTPLTAHRNPDLHYIQATAERIAEHLQDHQLVILESSTYPGTTIDVVKPILQNLSRNRGKPIYLAYSPEREDPGSEHFSIANTPKVMGGDSEMALQLTVALYSKIVKECVPVSNCETAEAVKLTENIFRAVNIALVNELKLIFKSMKIDVWEVIDAAATKPFGFMPFYPGPGLGGHCIPIDPFYLTYKARENGVPTRFIELAGEINTFMPRYVVSQCANALNEKQAKALNGAKVLVCGLSYKKNIDDIRESPSLDILSILRSKGAHIDYYDPFVSELKNLEHHPELAGKKSISWSVQQLKSYHAVIIATDHDDVDYPFIASTSPLIIDTRNVLARLGISGEHIIKA